MKVEIIGNIGFCNGVKSAFQKSVLIKKSNPNKEVYIYGQLVHNNDVIDALDNNGIHTLDTSRPDEEIFSSMENGSILIFPADGHKQSSEDLAKKFGFEIYDTICPLVERNIKLLKQEIKLGKDSIYIGMSNHDESINALDLSNTIHLLEKNKPFDFSKISISDPLVAIQTTLSTYDVQKEIEYIKNSIPNARIAGDVCGASLKRQQAVRNYQGSATLVYIVGNENSSNTNRLVEIGNQFHPNIKFIRILNVNEINKNDLKGHSIIGITSGTSSPDEKVLEVKAFLESIN